MIQLADIDVWDIIEIYLPTYNCYKWRAKVVWISNYPNTYPLTIEYLDEFTTTSWRSLLWTKSWIKLSEIISSEKNELMEKDFKFIKL
jgi:hypothetical protein